MAHRRPDPHVFECETTADFGAIRREIYDFGFVIIRSLISPQRVAEYARIAERTYSTCELLLSLLDVSPNANKVEFTDPSLARLVDNVAIWQIESGYFAKINDGRRLDGLLMEDPIQKQFVDALLGGEWYPGASIVRRIHPKPDDHGKGAQGPIVMHCDGPYLSNHTFALNFWVPAVACPSDAPGLQLVPGPIEPLRHAYGHDWETHRWDQEKGESVQKHYSTGADAGPRYIPNLEVGDVVVFHNWIMHASYVTPNMTKPRMSFELQFNAPDRQQFEAFAA